MAMGSRCVGLEAMVTMDRVLVAIVESETVSIGAGPTSVVLTEGGIGMLIVG